MGETVDKIVGQMDKVVEINKNVNKTVVTCETGNVFK